MGKFIQEPKLWSRQWAINATAELKGMRENWQYILELYEHESRTKKARYDALLKQGFTEEQSIQLIKDA